MSFKIRDCQLEVLLQFMEDHRDFASGKFIGAQGRETQKRLWAELANILNPLGYGEKTPDKWQKLILLSHLVRQSKQCIKLFLLETWSDFKYQIKEQGSQVKVDQNATGGEMPTSVPFNSSELRILEILGGKQFYLGVGSNEVGFPSAICSKQGSNASSTLIGKKCTPTRQVEQLHTKSDPKLSTQPSTSHQPDEIFKVPKGLGEVGHITNEHDHHAYNYTPTVKKQKLSETEKAYGETIDLLKAIKNSIDDFKCTVKENLQEIAEAIKNK